MEANIMLLLLIIIAILLIICHIENDYKNVKKSEAFTLDVATENRLKAFSSLYNNGTLKVNDLALTGDLVANNIETTGNAVANTLFKASSAKITTLNSDVNTRKMTVNNNAKLDKNLTIHGNRSHAGDMHVNGGSMYITKSGGDSRFTVANERSAIANKNNYTVRYAGCSDYSPANGVTGSINLAIKGNNILKDVYLVEALYGDRNCTFNGIKGF